MVGGNAYLYNPYFYAFIHSLCVKKRTWHTYVDWRETYGVNPLFYYMDSMGQTQVWHQVTLSSELSHHPSKVYFYKIENNSKKIGMLGLSADISFWKTKMTSEDIYFPKLQRKFFKKK